MNYLKQIIHRILTFFRLVEGDLKYLDPTNLAKLQDEIIGKEFISQDDAKKHVKELNRFCVLFRAKLVPHNNLYIRTNIILAGLKNILGRFVDRDVCQILADNAFRHYIRDGFYMENFQYFRYVMSAYDRFYYTTITEDLDRIQSNYEKLASQKGLIALTTAVNSPVVRPCTDNGLFNYGSYSVYRTDRIYLLITHNPYIYEFKGNFHVKWDFGHYYLEVDGKPWVDQQWYTGYVKNPLAISNQTWVNNVICDDLINAEPIWRIPNGLPDTELKVLTSGSDQIILKIGSEITRTFNIKPDIIEVIDVGGTYTAMSLNKANYAEINAVYSPKCTKDHDTLQDRVYCKITGKRRVVKFTVK